MILKHLHLYRASTHASRQRDRNRQLRTDRMRAARALGTHTREQWDALKAACHHTCVRCKSASLGVERDHIVPVYLGGSDAIDNIQPLCARCNCSKGPECTDHRPTHWRTLMGGLA